MLRLCLLAAVLLVLSAAVFAQPQTGTRPGSEFPPARVYTLPDFWLNLNAATHYLEWVRPDFKLYFWNYGSWLDGDFQVRSPRLVMRGPDWNVVGGTQESHALDTLLDQLPFTGVRADGDALGLRWTAGYGTTTTDNLPSLIAGPPPARFTMNALGVAFPLHRGLGRLTRSAWTPDNLQAGPDRHSLWSLEFDPRLKGPLTLGASLGLDAGSYAEPVTFADRRSYQWNLQYQDGPVYLAGQQQSNGRAYGPNHVQNFRRGENLLTADGTFELSDNLTLSESYQKLGFQTPIEQPFQSVQNQSWVHVLSWQARDNLRLAAQWQDLASRSTGSLAVARSRQNLMRLDVFYVPDRAWELVGRMLRRDLMGQVSQQTGLQVTHLPADPHRITLGYDRLTGQAGGFGDQLVLSYQYRPDSGLGLNVDYSRLNQSFLDPHLTSASTSTFNCGLYYEPTARWTLTGNFNYSLGQPTGGKVQYSAELGYLFDEHQEVAVRYARNPFLTDALGLNRVVNPGSALTLELRQSWGGPLESEFHDRLRPRLDVQVLYGPAGRMEEGLRPLEGARVRLGSLAPARVGTAGQVRFEVEEGSYPLRLDLHDLGPNFEVVAGPPERLDLGLGQRQQVSYRVTAWSSVYAVVFNDVDGDRELPVGYIPMAALPLQLTGPAGQTILPSDGQGVARFAHLQAGSYRVTLTPGALPGSAQSTTPTSFEFALEPGQEKVIVIGVQSFARFSGRLLLQDGGKLQPAPAGVTLRRGKTILGATDEEGAFDLRVPAGTVELEFDRARLGSDLYPVDPDALRLKLAPDQVSRRDIVLARYAEIHLQLTLDGKPERRSGIPVEIRGGEFLYTDEAGAVVFENLRMGDYELEVSESSLPAGLRLARPGPLKVKVLSGSKLQLEIPLRRKTR